MSRPTFRRIIRLETLESRELLTAGGPSAEAQFMLEELNVARTNPAAAAQEFTTNLDANTVASLQYYNTDLNAVRNALSSATPRQPLAWNDQLAQAATQQSQYRRRRITVPTAQPPASGSTRRDTATASPTVRTPTLTRHP